MIFNDNVKIMGGLNVDDMNIGEELHRIAAEQDKTVEYLAQIAEHLENVRVELECVKKENERLAVVYNEAVKIINNLSERLTALEKNYDPTVIG